jgi:hypothetical protein
LVKIEPSLSVKRCVLTSALTPVVILVFAVMRLAVTDAKPLAKRWSCSPLAKPFTLVRNSQKFHGSRTLCGEVRPPPRPRGAWNATLSSGFTGVRAASGARPSAKVRTRSRRCRSSGSLGSDEWRSVSTRPAKRFWPEEGDR